MTLLLKNATKTSEKIEEDELKVNCNVAFINRGFSNPFLTTLHTEQFFYIKKRRRIQI